MRRSVAVLLGTTALAAALASPAEAQSLFTSRASFLAQLLDATTLDFEGIALVDDFREVGGSSDPVAFGDLTIATTNDFSRFYVIDAGYAGGTFSLASGATFSPQVFAGTNAITLSTVGGFRALGFEFGIGTGPKTLSIALAGGPTFTRTFGGTLPTPDFFGFIADAPVASVTITADNDVLILDNLTTANRIVPEPMTVTLLAVGLAGLGLVARRRRAQG